ncbi:MAG: efflux RND transporter permease subunit [Myxococcota bacterium]
MSLTEWAIRNDRVTGVFVAVLLIGGVSAYAGMPQQMDPGFLTRVAQIVTIFPGASPDRIEQLVTDPIEQAVQAIPELDYVTSTSRTGVSIVSVNIREEFTNIRPVFDDLRRKVDAVRGDLPSGVIGPNVNDELGDIYPIMFSMVAEGYSDAEMTETAETIRDQLLHVDGVGKVDILGDQDERIFVEFSNARLSQLGLSALSLRQALATRNIIAPGGEIDLGAERLALEPSGNFGSVEELRETLIPLPTGSVAYLGDITEVTRGYIDPPQALVTLNGERALTLAVNMSDGNNLVELGARVRAFFDNLTARYPHGIEFEQTYFQPNEVEAKVSEFADSVLQAIAIVLVVMLLSLGLRTGFVVSTLIPTAMIMTILVLSTTSESINQMSLAALIIALGLLVDNAIVVTESVLLRMGKGESAVEASIASCKELRIPLLISSLTTSAAFLPIFLAESAVGEYTGVLFTVVTITLLISWVLSITMIPLLCVWILRVPKNEGDPYAGRFYRAYRRLLTAILRRRWMTLGAVIAAFVASLQLWGLVPAIFFPAQERAFFMAELSLPSGVPIESTREMNAAVDRFMRTEQEEGNVRSWTTFMGETPVPFTLGYSPSPSLAGFSELMVNTVDVDAVPGVMERLERWVLDEFPDVQTDIRMLAAGPPVTKPVEIRISGSDTERLFEIVDDVQQQLNEIPGAQNIDTDWGARVKKLVVRIDQERARRAGVSHQDIATAMQAYLTGIETTRYREEDESIPVVVRSLSGDRRDLDRVRDLAVPLPGQTGTIPLSQVADIDLVFEAARVKRRDRYRTVTVRADVTGDTTAIGVVGEIEPWMIEQQAEWPVGYRYEFGGEIESSVEANQSIGDKLPIAGLIIVLLLVGQFNSLRKPIVVLSTIVLALIGVVIGLVVMESTFGFMTLLGIVSLAGIVINNAIVLLDRVQLQLDDGLLPFEAVVSAAEQRVRPILLTTATTVASLLPLYLTGGAMWRPMAVAIMFGLVFSTVLTLLVVPLSYAILFRVPNDA